MFAVSERPTGASSAADDPRPPRASSAAPAAALAGIVLLALAVRLLGVGEVFVDGEVFLAMGDPYYHLRLAEYAWAHFPDYLIHDAYLNFPDGAAVPWPPFYDLLVAGSVRLVGGSARGLEIAAALWPPLLSALSVLCVHRIGRAVGGLRCGLGAALLFAVLPAAVVTSRVGYADHHAAVAFLGAALLALQVGALESAPGLGRAVLLAATRAALVLGWSGSLAYLAVAEIAFVGVAAGLARGRALVVEASSLLGTALLVAPFAARSPASLGGAFSAIELSWLHVVACLAAACWGMAGAWASSEPTPARRLLRTALAGALLGGGLLAVPALREGLGHGGDFVLESEAWGTWSGANPEQQPFFYALGGRTWAEVLMGHLGWLVPLAPLALLARALRAPDPGAALLTAAWTAVFGALTLLQTRFAGDLAASVSVGFAVLLGGVGSALASRLGLHGRLSALPSIVLAGALLAPALVREHGAKLPATARWLSGSSDAYDRALHSVSGTAVRFAHVVREATPETSGFLDASGRPEYGILADPSIGHVLHYVARRPTPSDNFGPNIGAENFLATLRVLFAREESEALEDLERLQVRYVVSSWQVAYPGGSLLHRLHDLDGRAEGTSPALAHFRLVVEGPAEGRPVAGVALGSDQRVAAPYKLFEVVPGALLEVEAAPGTRVRASVTVGASSRRRFVHRTFAHADEEGLARLRVPYATASRTPAGPLGPYRIVAGDARFEVEVGEEALLEGGRIAVPGPSARNRE